MSAQESGDDALFRDPLPAGFSKRVLRVASGLELDLDATGIPDPIVLVEEGELELECSSGPRRRFARGSMIPIGRLHRTRIRSVGRCPLVLVAVSRAHATATDEFPRSSGS